MPTADTVIHITITQKFLHDDVDVDIDMVTLCRKCKEIQLCTRDGKKKNV
jgi:hypothetical protein